MKSGNILYLAFLMLIFFGGCLSTTTSESDENKIPGPSFNFETFQQNWVHSYEEDPEDYFIDIFRPADYKDFGPGWFRMEYRFKADSLVDWLFLAPNDGHYFKAGTWWVEINEDTLLYVGKDETIDTLRIIELNDSTLILDTDPLTKSSNDH